MGALPICFEVEAARDFEPSAREAADRVRIAMIAVPAEAMLVTQGRREFGAARHDRGIDARRDGRVSAHVAAIFEIGGQNLTDLEIGADIDLAPGTLVVYAPHRGARFGRRPAGRCLAARGSTLARTHVGKYCIVLW